MTAWTSDELGKIGAAEQLQIASLRRDGTLRKPVTIWVARHGDDLYIRSGDKAASGPEQPTGAHQAGCRGITQAPQHRRYRSES
jgi:hypothetical protein